MADSSDFGLSINQESTLNTFEASGGKLLRTTGTSALNGTRATIVSDELVSGRHPGERFQNARSVTGTINTEFAYDEAIDWMLEGLLHSATWTAEVTQSVSGDGAITASTGVCTGTNIHLGLSVGDWIRFELAGAGANRGYIAHVIVVGTDTITVDGVTLGGDVGPTATFDVVKLSEINVGSTRTARSFSLEKRFNDISIFTPFYGCNFVGVSGSLSPEGKMELAWDVLGMDQYANTDTSEAITGPSAVSTTEIYLAGDATVIIGGIPQDCITDVDFTLSASAEPRRVIQPTAIPKDIRIGQFLASGSFSLVLDDEEMMNYAENDTALSIALKFTDSATVSEGGNTYIIEIARIRLETPDANPSGPNVDIPLVITWASALDPTTSESVRIWKIDAA